VQLTLHSLRFRTPRSASTRPHATSSTRLPIRARRRLRRLPIRNPLEQITDLAIQQARIPNYRGIPQIPIHARHNAGILDAHIVEGAPARVLRAAVAAAAVQFADVGRVEVLYGYGAPAVVL
jgi:hypothetical protein